MARVSSDGNKTAPTGGRQVAWLAAGLAIGFLTPYLFTDRMHLQRDLYYGVYIAVTVAFFLAWAHTTGQAIGPMLQRHWRLMLVLSGASGMLLTLMVLRTEDATPGPDGLKLVAAVAWRGVLYGLADGLLLSAFPILAVFAAAGGERRRHWTATAAIGTAAMMASLAMTAVYHLGYADFRSGKVIKPVLGDVVWSIPTLATLNPAGAPIAHAGLHVAAVLHSYETDVFLPPHE